MNCATTNAVLLMVDDHSEMVLQNINGYNNSEIQTTKTGVDDEYVSFKPQKIWISFSNLIDGY